MTSLSFSVSASLKVGHNFTVRKYRRQSLAPVVDPVIACSNILQRAHILAIPKNEPVGKFRKSKGRNDCLPATYTSQTMPRAVSSSITLYEYCIKKEEGNYQEEATGNDQEKQSNSFT